jgi:adenine modification enzyme
MKDYIFNEQIQLFGQREVIGFGEEGFYIKEIDRNLANEIIVKNHYSHKYYNATYIHLGVFIDNELIGVLQYGYAMNPASQASVVANTAIDEYLELNRMWLDDKAGKNSESKAISYSIRYIKRKFPKIKWIQSFADERCGCFGIVYQACSFGYYGEHTSTFYTLDGQVYHKSLMERNPELSKSAKYLQENKDRTTSEELRQFRYIKFIDQRCKKDCLWKEQPYLKYYNGD